MPTVGLIPGAVGFSHTYSHRGFMNNWVDSPCTLWTGALEKTGYGRRKIDGKMWLAHRWAYQEFYGDLRNDMVVDHLCFTRACINPLHLRQITREENSARHKPGCTCTPCNPVAHMRDFCAKGHDLTLPGARKKPRKPGWAEYCAQCVRDQDRDRKRAKRAAERERINPPSKVA